MFGEITISGAKNAAVAIIPAALLVDGVCRIENIPQISDVTLLFTILEDMGAKVKVLNQHAVQIDCHSVHSTQPCYDLARKIRASYYLLGALLGYVGSSLLDAPSLPSVGSIALAVGFSLAVGVFFGYYPANKAAKMNPIDALRYE